MSPRRSFWDLFNEIPREPARGRSALDLFNAADEAEDAPDSRPPCALAFDEEFVFWAMANLPVSQAVKHFLICGAVGAGKTSTIELFLQSIAERFRAGRRPPEQLIVFDAKRDILPLLAGMGLRPGAPNVWLLNPFDERSAIWDIAETANEPAMARYVASLLVPEEQQATSPFFASAARDLVVYAMWGLQRHLGTRWTFRDLLCALDSKQHIRAVTAWHPRAARLAGAILDDTRHAFGVLATLTTKLSRFEEIAALWHSRPEAPRFSVSEFLQRPGVLVLGHDPVLTESLWPINAIVLKALTDEILRGPDTRRPRHWFVLDEFRAMRNVDCIHDLLNRGRSKGASVLLGLQSTEGLIDVYKEHRAADILSACAYKTFLHLGDPKTAAWAEQYFGQVRRHEPVITHSYGSKSGSSTSNAEGLQDRPLFLASYFLNLPFAEPGGPYKAVSDVPWLGATVITELPFDNLNACRQPPDRTVPVFVPHPNPADQTLPEWTPEEEAFHGFKKPRKKKQQSPKQERKPLPKRDRNPDPPLTP
jgi:hypothetical protein